MEPTGPADWLIVRVWFAIEIEPVRATVPGLGETRKGTMADPCPLPTVDSIQGTVLYTAHTQLFESIVRFRIPVLPCAPKLNGVPVAVASHPEPLCVTLTGLPAMVSVAVRWPKLFGAADIVMVAGPVPLSLAVMVSHGALDLAVQMHSSENGRLRFSVPPLEPKDSDPRAMTGS